MKLVAPWPLWGLRIVRWKCCSSLREKEEKGWGNACSNMELKIMVQNGWQSMSRIHRQKGFYEHMEFRVYKRTELDEQGNPYPLLYMELSH